MITRERFINRTLASVRAFADAKRVALHVVGGAIRDALLGREQALSNVDLAIPAHALEVAQELAVQLGGTYICLAEDMGAARVVVSSGQERLELDLSDFRGKTLEEDLNRRDFTVNAMAVPLEVWDTGARWTARIVDPLGGRTHLEQRRLVACSAQAFQEDPIRILRAFRFSVQLGFSMDPPLQPLMAAAVSGLKRIAGERIRDELFAVFQTNQASRVLQALDHLGGLCVLFPELEAGRDVHQGGYHHLDVFGHQLETVAQCDAILAELAEFTPALRAPLADYCATSLVEGRSRAALVKLAGLYHDVGKPATRRVETDGEIWFIGHEQFGACLVEAATERLRLSNREAEMIRRLVLYHLRPGHLSREPQLTRRAIFRFFRDLGDDGPACLLVWWADRLATRGPSSRLDQIDQQRARLEELLRAYFFKAEEVIRPPRLVDGTQLMAALGIPPGPLVGRLLQAIQEAQAEGQLHTPDDALALAREQLRSDRPA